MFNVCLSKNNGFSHNDVNLMMRIADIFHKIGIPANILGYYYAREAIAITSYDRDVITAVTKLLYPTVAKTFSTTPYCVERAIRRAIEVAWARGDIDTLCHYFGHTINSNKNKPTNSEFIAAISEYITLRSMISNESLK